MNVKRIKEFIQVMRDVEELDKKQDHDHFDIGTWGDNINSKGQHTCDTVACALGWLAVSEKGRAGGLRNRKHSISLKGTRLYDENAGAKYLGVSRDIAYSLFFRSEYFPVIEVKPSHVIGKLQHLLKWGPEKYMENHDKFLKIEQDKYWNIGDRS